MEAMEAVTPALQMAILTIVSIPRAENGWFRAGLPVMLSGMRTHLPALLMAAGLLGTGCQTGNLPPNLPASSGYPTVGYIVENPTEAPKPVFTPPPPYPRQAIEQRFSGDLIADCLVDERGRVRNVQFAPGTNTLLAENTRSTLLTWWFEPARKDGRAVATWIHVPISYRPPPDAATP